MDDGFERWARAYNVAPLNSLKRTRELLGGCGHDLVYQLALDAASIAVRCCELT